MAKPPFVSFLKKAEAFYEPFDLYQRLKNSRPSVLLESARHSPKMGRYSLVAVDPFLTFQSKSSNALEKLRGLLKKHRSMPTPGFPSFTGGAIGYFSYEIKNRLEPHLPQKAKNDLGLPEIYFLFFDEGILFDHEKKVVWYFVTVPNKKNSSSQAQKKLTRFSRRVNMALKKKISKISKKNSQKPKMDIRCSLEASHFMNNVERAKEFIQKGDIFQANLSQRFSFKCEEDAALVYQKLKKINPSSFFGLLETPDFQIISGSPERLVKCENGLLETRPIAGTRSRGKTASLDNTLSMDLLLNEKERAEHIMLVDLERNDLGRVAEYGSVSVDELMTVEDYSHVKHIVSNVKGVLRQGLDTIDVLKAFFPGGTITGAPKVRCMEIIDSLEPLARGPYTGSLGYFSFSGNMDFNIIIRSLVIKNKVAHLQVGAGIVADSIPRKEYEETLYKAEAVLSSIFGEKATHKFFSKL